MAFSPRDTRSVVDGGKNRPHSINGLGNDSAFGRYNSDQHGKNTHYKQMFSPSTSHDKMK